MEILGVKIVKKNTFFAQCAEDKAVQWDWNDPDRKEKEQPTRMGDDDPRLGVRNDITIGW